MKKSDREERRRKLSEKAIAFYAQHNVTDTVEKLLNQLYVAAPSDVYGYMVRHIMYPALYTPTCFLRHIFITIVKHEREY